MIKLVNVNKYFGDLHVLKDVNLEVAEGEKLVIIGPSGSGKSTTVRCMNFLEEPTSGEVWIDGTLLTNKNKTQLNRTTMSMVFQQFNLYPHKTVLQNLTLAPIKLHHKPKKEAEELAYHYLDVVGLRDKANVYPTTLSGGQQLSKENITMVVVTHEMGFARQVADRVIFMADGTIIEEGPPEHFFENPTHERTKQFLSKILR